jgi:long-chain fatty acid transport protein
MNKFAKGVLPVLLSGICVAPVAAAGFQQAGQSAAGLGSAYAGSAAQAEDASALYANPASLSLLSGGQISLGGVGRYDRQKFTGAAAGNADSNHWLGLPNLYLSQTLNSSWSIGLGLSSPFAYNSNFPSGWAGSGQALQTRFTSLNLNPSLAYKLNEQWSFGFGLNHQQLDARLSAAGGINYLKADAAAWGWNAGALYQVSPSMRLGLAYRSGFNYTLKGEAGTPAGGAEAKLKLPSTLTWSVYQQVSDNWEMLGDLSYSNWSRLNSLDINNGSSEAFNLKNSWRLAWGAANRLNDRTKLKFGLAYERGAIGDGSRSARLPDSNSLTLAIGAQYRLLPATVLDVGYAYTGYKDASINALGGHFENVSHQVGVQLNQGF